MKEKIEKKLEECAESIIAKENPTMDDINFIVFLLNRIEGKENAERLKIEKEKLDRETRERIANMIGGVYNG